METSEVSNLVVKIKKDENPLCKGILYIGQYGTSGYAVAAKGYLYHFASKGIPVSWIPLKFDDSEITDDSIYNLAVKSLINRPVVYDTVILHCTPDLWPSWVREHPKVIYKKHVVGYTVWESSKLPPTWVDCINKSVQEVWCPSEYNKQVFLNSGVEIPIFIFPHIWLNKELPKKDSVKLISASGEEIEKNFYTFYNISEWNARKSIDELIHSFCQEFSKDEKVRLLLKVHYRNYDESNKLYCINKTADILKLYPNSAPVSLITSNLMESELISIHSIGDCYVSLCKSEGFGLTIFDAFNFKKSIIVTGHGGHIDFLGKNFENYVKFKVSPVSGMEDFSSNYTPDQEWAVPDIGHARQLMRQTYEQSKNSIH